MRLEYKFLIQNRQIAGLKESLIPFLAVDPYAEERNNEYTVRSIYFDTSGLKYYHEKIDGMKVRKKLRIRGYNDYNHNNMVFLEIKRKYESYITKNRAAVNFHDLSLLFQSGDINAHILPKPDPATAVEDARRFLHHIYKNHLRPTVLVVYDREAYFSKFNSNLRITIDKNLRYLTFPSLSDLYDEDRLQLAQKTVATLEIKFYNGFPQWLVQIIQENNLFRQALSKYTICLDAEQSLHAIRRRSTIAHSDRFWQTSALKEWD